MKHTNINIIQHKTVFEGYLRIARYRLQHQLFGGGMSAELVREVVERGQVAAVLPYDPVRDEVVLIEQFRPGVMGTEWDPWLVECVAGIVEPGESAEAMAIREAREECGAAITDLMPMHRFLTTPGILRETVSLFCGRTDAGGIDGIHGVASEGEDIRAFTLPRERALEMLNGGRIVNAITLVALQWLALNHDRVQHAWR